MINNNKAAASAAANGPLTQPLAMGWTQTGGVWGAIFSCNLGKVDSNSGQIFSPFYNWPQLYANRQIGNHSHFQWKNMNFEETELDNLLLLLSLFPILRFDNQSL